MINVIQTEKFNRGRESIVATFYQEDVGNYRYSIQQKYLKKDKSLNTRYSDFSLGNLRNTSEEKFKAVTKRIIKKSYVNVLGA